MTDRFELTKLGLLLRLQQLVDDAKEAGYDDTLAFDLDGIVGHYENLWHIRART